MKLLLASFLLVTAAACGPKSKPADQAPPGGGQPVAWADMDHEQREAYMRDTVLPTMKAKFVEFDAAEFGEMSCTTCHVSDEDHEMPNPKLPSLDFANMDKLDAHDQKAVEFMKSTVVPEMAKLLGTTPYDPATQLGFGCTVCHTTVDAK